MPSFRDVLRNAKAQIAEVDTAAGEQMVADGAALLDVREPDEYAQGSVPGAIHIARGMLESSIESRLADRDIRIVVMCAGGARSALAVRSLQELGYTNAVSMDGGFNKWKDEGRTWSVPATLSAAQRLVYQRHLTLPEVGEQGQLALLNARVLCLGAGGLGSPAAMYLAAAGVGTLGIVDMDVVDASNLQRQILHNRHRIGDRKVDSARQTLTELNADVLVITHDVRLDASNMEEIIAGYDIVVDGTDNFPVRYMLNDASVKLGIPVVHASIFRFDGQITVFDPRNGPTYRDMLPAPPPPELAPSCAEAGVLGVLPGIVGSIQALEAIKMILGVGDVLRGRLLVFDALEMSFSEFALHPDPANVVTWDNRDQITVVPLVGMCAPAPLVAP